MSKQTQALECHALAAHHAGTGWTDFWQQYGIQAREAEPYNRRAFHRLVRRLLALVASGDTDGQHPVAVGLLWGSSEEWDDDDGK